MSLLALRGVGSRVGTCPLSNSSWDCLFSMNGNKGASPSPRTQGASPHCWAIPMGFRSLSENSLTCSPTLDRKAGHMELTSGPCLGQVQEKELDQRVRRWPTSDTENTGKFCCHFSPGPERERTDNQQMLDKWTIKWYFVSWHTPILCQGETCYCCFLD